MDDKIKEEIIENLKLIQQMATENKQLDFACILAGVIGVYYAGKMDVLSEMMVKLSKEILTELNNGERR